MIKKTIEKAPEKPMNSSLINVRPGNESRPNILWIVLDHVTFRHFKMTKGAKPILNTYERLASEGVEFTNCHSVHPLCLPARATMMTGVYSHKHGKINNGLYPDAGYPLLAEYLKQLGYQMGYFGKNHSGYEDLQARGFEGFYPSGYGNPYRTREYQEYLEKKGLLHPIFHQEWSMITDPANGHLYENGDYDLTESDNFNTYSAGYLKTPGQVHEADFISSMAMDWLDERSGKNRPFVLQVNMWGPHHSYQVPLESKEAIKADEIEEYPSFRDEMKHRPRFAQEFLKGIRNRNSFRTWPEWQMVMKRAYEQYSYIDSTVGKLLDKLEQNGMAGNTIVIYTADHGDSLGSHGGMVDKAGDMMEELMHIPMVIRWPGFTKGTKSHALVSNLDLVPTVLDMAGIDPPGYMDGQSMVALLKGGNAIWREDFMAQHYGHFQNHVPQRALYYQNYKYIAADGDVHELYDLEKDPFELDNLVNNPALQDVVREMRGRLLDTMDRHGDTGMNVKNLRNGMDSGK